MNRSVAHQRARAARFAAKRWRQLRACLLMPTLGLAARFSRRPLVDPSSEVVVSLTSYGTRLRSVHLTLASIGRGRARPARLILWVDPGVEESELPSVLRGMRERGLEIATSPRDCGPHKKYFAYVTSQTQHESTLVTADDDVVYPRWWLSQLRAASLNSEDIVCFRAHRMRFQEGRLAPYNSWLPVRDRFPSLLNFATGVSGVAYPPTFLDQLADLGDRFADVCPFADDVWLHFVAVTNGRQIRQVKRRPQKFPDLPSTQSVGLHRINTAQRANDRQIALTYSTDALRLLQMVSTST